MNTHLQTRMGFSLIEVVVSVTLLSFAIVGPLSLSAQSIRATREARLQLIAVHLAEEGIEIIHNVRDNNSADDLSTDRDEWMEGSSIDVDILDECKQSFGCIIDLTEHPEVLGNGGGNGVWTEKVIDKCNGNCRTEVYQHPTTGLYRQKKNGLASPWVVSPFKRVIQVIGVDDSSNPEKQVRVTSTVTYVSYGGKTRSIVASDDLYNWFPNLN